MLVPPESSSGTAPVTIKPSSSLVEAAVYRVIQLVENAEPPAVGGQSRTVEEICDIWWGQWQCFADQFYAFVDNGFIDFEQFVAKLSRARMTGTLKRDNAIVWLLTQCLPLDGIKQLFLADFKQHGRLFAHLVEFYNPIQAERSRFDLRDTSLACLVFRTQESLSTPDSKVDPVQYVPLSMKSIVEGKKDTAEEYKDWWQKNGKNLFNFFFVGIYSHSTTKYSGISRFLSSRH